MTPVPIAEIPEHNGHTHSENTNGHTNGLHREPLQLKGALSGYEQFDVTPCIGREFRNVDLAEWLRASNSDELLRDLAITSESTLDTKRRGAID